MAGSKVIIFFIIPLLKFCNGNSFGKMFTKVEANSASWENGHPTTINKIRLLLISPLLTFHFHFLV